MRITDPMVLPSDVRVLPVSELPPGLRRRLGADAGDFAVAHPRERVPDKILAAASAELLAEFRQPRRIVDAVLAYSRSRDLDPAAVLADSYPLLSDLLNHRLLVPADSPEALEIVPALKPGQRIGGGTVLRSVQVLSDSELYQMRRGADSLAALKIARSARASEAGPMLAREARILAHLEGAPSPRLYASGVRRGCRYLMVEWRPGVSPEIVAAEAREAADGRARSRLLALAVAIVEAYSGLHAQGVIHGDVHPGNILVDGDGRVSILDFGLSRLTRGRSVRSAPRGGVGFFFEPEYAGALQRGVAAPPPTEWGEQYSVAAFLYLLCTGQHYLPFSPHESEIWRQIVEEEPLPFSRLGIRPWPEVERHLARALSKPPERRFASMAEFATALKQVRVVDASPPRYSDDSAERFLATVLTEVGPDGPLSGVKLPHPPTASVNLGAAGIAYGLYRIACVRGDPALLSAADLWLAQAQAELDRAGAWQDAEAGITPEVVGRISPYHCPAGVHCVAAALSQATGDPQGQSVAIAAFVRASGGRTRNPELVLGRSGTLLASALLREALRDHPRIDASLLTELGEETLDGLLDRLKRFPPIERCREFPNLGVAHGWAGVLFAIIRWCRARERAIPDAVPVRLGQLARCAEYSGRGAVWRWVSRESVGQGPPQYMPGWCNGSAGFVFLWTLAHRALGEANYLELAEQAGWDAWESPAAAWDLCCGLTGRGFALLNLYQNTGDAAWLERARTLASRAVRQARERPSGEGARYRHSLFRGTLGLACLIADLEHPDQSCLPMFGEEGWRRG